MTPILLILKTGSTFPELAATLGDFEDWIRDSCDTSELEVRIFDARHEPLPSMRGVAGVVITGSHAMVSDRETWSEAAAVWLHDAVQAGMPVLGICYGHQLLAHCLGGDVNDHPEGLEVGSVVVRMTPAAVDDPLFSALPLSFAAQEVHRQSVLRLPGGAVALAQNGHDPHQAFRVGESAWGVQFHPEFNAQAMRAYVDELASELKEMSFDARALSEKVVNTPDAVKVLLNFAKYVRQRKFGTVG